jgi:hypothetical protein
MVVGGAAAAQLDPEGKKGIKWRRTREKRGSRDSGRDLGFHADNFAVVKVVVSLISQEQNRKSNDVVRKCLRQLKTNSK